jgi:class 3 adenylate cyclase
MAAKDPTDALALEHASGARAQSLNAAQTTEVKIALPFGMVALGFAVASMAMCVAPAIAEFLFGLEPNSLDPNPHAQAVMMWVFGMCSIFAMWRDRNRHNSSFPVALGIVGVVIMVINLYVRYYEEIEIFSYMILTIAAILNLNAFTSVLNRTVRQQAHEIATLNRGLEVKVESQGHEIDRLGRLKQFLAPQVAELVVAEGKDKLLETHRRYIACLFCDIRGFTALSEDMEPEEVIAILQAYHERVGRLVAEHRGTIGFRAGDGLMVFFNDPVPCEEPVLDAVKLALAVRAAFAELREPWSKRGHAIGLGLGIASGYATLGLVGLQGRTDYTAIGGAVNIASRICDKATDGQILITQRAYLDVEARVEAKPLGKLELKGVKQATEVYNIVGLNTAPA